MGDQLNAIFPLVNVVFANEDESQSFAKANDIKFEGMKDLAVKISQYKCEKDERTCIITQGAEAVIVAKGEKVTSYPVPKIDKDAIVGTYAAQYMIQRAGTKLEGKPTFDAAKC